LAEISLPSINSDFGSDFEATLGTIVVLGNNFLAIFGATLGAILVAIFGAISVAILERFW
jgi:hypothetical protein